MIGESLVHLDPNERQGVQRYLARLREVLQENLQEVWLYGSAARGDMWRGAMPIHSDVDLLVLTREPVPAETQASLVNDTYPLFLECGRQISPQFRTWAEFEAAAEPRAWAFRERVLAEGRKLIGRAEGASQPPEKP